MAPIYHLTIDYRLDGPRPGYQFTTATDGFRESTLKTVWRHAMPRGQGWGALPGARSVKCFPVNASTVAISDVVVTDRVDEEGRRGLRRAEIDLMTPADYETALRARLKTYPAAVRKAAGHRMSVGTWVRVLLNTVPRLGGGERAVLAARYTTPEDWQVMAFMVLYLSARWSVRAVRGWPRMVSLTTLALESRDESTIIAMPEEQAAAMRGTRIIHVPG